LVIREPDASDPAIEVARRQDAAHEPAAARRERDAARRVLDCRSEDGSPVERAVGFQRRQPASEGAGSQD
jgi:hypothetical protein